MRHLALICLSLFAASFAGAFIFFISQPTTGLKSAKTPSEFDRLTDPLVPPIRTESDAEPFTHDSGAVAHAHGDTICASGCAVSRHPTTRLTADAFRKLVAKYQQSAPTGKNRALEEILFFGRQSRQHWHTLRLQPIAPLWQLVLDEELEKTHALVSLRVIDESGDIRSKISHVRVPLDRRHIFKMQTKTHQSLITSGTVKRVGLDHLWTRL